MLKTNSDGTPQRAESYTDEELATLTTGEVTTLIQIEMAYSGTPIAIDPGRAPAILNIEPTVRMYTIGGVESRMYDTMEAAQQAAAIPSFRSDYDYQAGYSYKYAEPNTAESGKNAVREETFYEKSVIDGMKQQLTEYREAKELWERANNAYNDALRKSRDVASSVNERIANHNKMMQRRTHLRATYNRYCELAGPGNHNLAWTFLVDAMNNDRSMTGSDGATKQELLEWLKTDITTTPPTLPQSAQPGEVTEPIDNDDAMGDGQ